MFDRLTIRSVSEDVAKALNVLAARHDRSVEAEARFAVRSWVQPILQREEQSARRTEVSKRLRDVLHQVNNARRYPTLRPSHIALAIGEAHAEPTEKWFTGELEPSFQQLDAIAVFLGCVSAWLQHGDGAPFPVRRGFRIPEDPAKAVNWLLDLEEGDLAKRVTHLRLVRSGDKTGNFAVVKEYQEKRCQTYFTPYHISEEIGGGGESSLVWLSLILNLLYKFYVKRGSQGLVISSYIVPEASFNNLISGRDHPLAAVQDDTKLCWWEDFWDVEQFRKEQNIAYWPGWRAFCERIYSAVEYSSSSNAQLSLINSGTHPLLM